MTQAVRARISAPRGLNDRKLLPHLANGEFANAMNVELHRRAVEKRLGFTRLGGPLKGGSIRLDGVNDYLRIKRLSDYDPSAGGNEQFYFACNVILRSRPDSATPETLMSWGFGGGVSHIVDIRYDSSAGTGGLGAWVARVRDAGGGSTVTVTLDYGDGTDSIVGKKIFLELWVTTVATSLTRWTDDGTKSEVFGLGYSGWATTTGVDLFVGVGTTTTNTIGSDFLDATISEMRLCSSSASTVLASTSNLFYKRQLTPFAIASTQGYWKCDDGDLEPRCSDSSTTNNPALIVNGPALWASKSDYPLVLGDSGVSFNRGNSWISVNDIDGTKVTQIFNNATVAGNKKRWTVRGILILPTLPVGYTTFPDAVLFWMGTSTTLPSPVGLRIVSDAFEAIYDDNGTPRTMSLSGGSYPTVTSLAGKRIRWAVYRSGSGNGGVTLGITIDNGDGTLTSHFDTEACTSNTPGTVSSDIAFGRHVTNFANARLGDQTAFHTDGSLIGILDDIQFIHTNDNNTPVGTGAFAGTVSSPIVFSEQSAFGPNSTVHLWLKLNQGGGSFIESLGSDSGDAYGGWRCYLLPETDDGARWDEGLVEPFLPERGTFIFPYNRFLADGTRTRSVLVGSGTTLSAYDTTNGLRVVGALPGRAEACTAAQYGSKVIIAGPVGRRPVVYDGGTVRNLGIRAPSSPAAVTLANGSGTFVNGSYYLYVTYRSVQGDTITESNPGPGLLVTFSGADDTIDSISLPRSPDPQVNQRRIWMTAVGGADGAAAYLVATVDDNITTSRTDDITSVSTSSATLEYFENEEAPDATTVGQFLDYTLLGGNQSKPTRLFYSAVGVPDSWNTETDGRYLDLDLDSGNPILAIAPLLDRAIVDLGDGKWAIYATGDETTPLAKTRVNNTHGAVGPQASFVSNNRQFYIGETDIWLSDGYREENLSSPPEHPVTAPVYVQQLGRTSIQTTMREKIDWTQRGKFCAFEHRSKNQLWFCVRMTDAPSWMTGNSHVLVHDIVQGFWSRYDIPIDTGTWGEIASEEAEPLAVVQGWLVRLDQDTGEGLAASSVLTVTSESNASTGTTLGFGGTPFSGIDYRFCRAWVYHKSDHTIQEHRVVGVPSSSSLLVESNDTTVATGDLVIVAAAPYFVDYVPQFGDANSTKALNGVSLNIELVSGSPTLRVQTKGDVRTPPTSLSGYSSTSLALSSSIISRWLALGGLGTNFYVRFSETGYAAGTGQGVFPGGASFRIHGTLIEGRETSSRSRS